MAKPNKAPSRPAPATPQPQQPAAADAAPVAEAPQPARIAVTAEVDGFRRGGRAWSRQRTIVAVSELTDAQLAAIRGEPRLHVVDLDEAGE